MLNWLVESVKPVPLVYTVEPDANCVNTKLVVPTVIGSGVVCTQDVLALVVPAVIRK